MWLALLIVTGQLFATVDPASPYPVELLYELEPQNETRDIALTVLEVRGASMTELTANGESIVLDRADAPLLRGALVVPAGASVITFRYRATGTTLPIVVLQDVGEARFEASLRLPPDQHLVESFPTALAPSGDGYALSLPIVPAFVSLTLRDRRPVVTLPRLLDGLTLLILGGLAAVAIRRRR